VCDSFYYSSTDFHEFAYIQGSGKTTLLKAIVNKCKPSTATYDDAVSDFDLQEVIADGLCYCDSAGINMQVFSFSPCFPLFFLLLFPAKWPVLYKVGYKDQKRNIIFRD
jgi:hypothetical protein